MTDCLSELCLYVFFNGLMLASIGENPYRLMGKVTPLIKVLRTYKTSVEMTGYLIFKD